MQFEFILLAIFFYLLRKQLPANEPLLKYKHVFNIGLALSIAILILNKAYSDSRIVTEWIGNIMVITAVTLIYQKEALLFLKPMMIIVLPLIFVNLGVDLSKAIGEDFADSLDNYFDVAGAFAVVWLIAMFFIYKKERKKLEKERLKAEEREKEFRITENLKAQLEIQVAERTAALTLQKDQLEHAILDLKTTQSQLIQAEKMASLGELTAGIAHEIQNPLNFVNNFSEVSNELIDEMYAELDKGDIEEVKAIAADIKQNLQKINHHGKRADAIVKGMLQHSRSSTGIKEPTDINKLADEYLRLAYHGLRAKDKSFNATLKTDFDETIGNINIMAQDMGRVILNLFTNAFYAVNERKKEDGNNYDPIVSVSTKKLEKSTEIVIGDNGNGIPQKILDKIFQPFFTTKPTGQGTGLGLSLSYDIVNAHGGELKVLTKEGEGTKFVISLPV
ncbi:MAG: ATP-binding protein [Bacteroidota bacterium]